MGLNKEFFEQLIAVLEKINPNDYDQDDTTRCAWAHAEQDPQLKEMFATRDHSNGILIFLGITPAQYQLLFGAPRQRPEFTDYNDFLRTPAQEIGLIRQVMAEQDDSYRAKADGNE